MRRTLADREVKRIQEKEEIKDTGSDIARNVQVEGRRGGCGRSV